MRTFKILLTFMLNIDMYTRKDLLCIDWSIGVYTVNTRITYMYKERGHLLER